MNKQIPGARWLHEYANLYFDAHNPMLSRCRARNSEICVLRVDHAVLDIAETIISTRNAASDWASFWPVADGLSMIERDRIFARYWTHPNDPFEEMSHKSEKCAEVLVPERVDGALVIGAYVANRSALAAFQGLATTLPAAIRGDMFF
jgi:ssDNA thymidine ADP-ribosyltransferase, DarT